MANQRRGFTKEKHDALKGVLTGLALIGFGAAWVGFAAGHESDGGTAALVLASADATSPTPTPVATRAPTAAVDRTVNPAAAATPKATAEPTAPPDPTARSVTPRRSRGS